MSSLWQARFHIILSKPLILQQKNWNPGWLSSGRTKKSVAEPKGDCSLSGPQPAPWLRIFLLPTSQTHLLPSPCCLLHPNHTGSIAVPPTLQIHSCLRAMAPVPSAQKGPALGFHMWELLLSGFGPLLSFQLKPRPFRTCPITLIYFLYSTYRYIELCLYFSSQLFVSPTRT